jgi:hypothetical protein
VFNIKTHADLLTDRVVMMRRCEAPKDDTMVEPDLIQMMRAPKMFSD